MKFSERLNELREKKLMSKTDLAVILGTTRQMVTRYEDGRSSPAIEVLAKAADCFECSADYLLGRSDCRTLEDDKKRKSLSLPSELTDEDIELVTEMVGVLHKRRLKAYWWYRYPNIPNKEDVISKTMACKNMDGGFANYPQNPSYLETLFYATVSLSLLNATDRVESDTIEYILNAHFRDGGFGEQESNHSNLFNTFYAVISLKVYDKVSSVIRDDVIRYLKNHILHSDGVYEKRIELMNTSSLFWVNAIAQSLSYQNAKLRDDMVSFCLSCYNDEENLFSAIPNGIPTIQNTYECLVILKECSALNLITSEGIYNAIMKRKNRALFLDDLLGYHTFSTTMWAILCLNVLDCLNKFETADVLAFASSAFVECGSIYDMFCAVNILTNIIYESGRIRTEKSLLKAENGTTESFDVINSLINDMEKRGFDYLQYDFTQLLAQSKSSDVGVQNSFMQVLLNKNSNRLYEIEVDEKNGLILSLIIPISRVTGECIAKCIISSNKIKLLGIFDTGGDLRHSRQEVEILEKYCKDNRLFKYSALVGVDATYENLKNKLNDNCHVFYYSGHCRDGNLYFSGQAVELSDVLTALVESHCAIVILNCCNSYGYVKSYFERYKYLNERLNVICTLNDVSDEQAKMFVTTLFRYLELGYPISEAVRSSKHDMYIEYKGGGNTWWSYLLFGNPFTIIDNENTMVTS